ncbi:MAG: hypothetical protein JWO03_1646 [Bacteroidetes bacterium]|nr:hypothetical protein [Bacteroidota bacterium]
MKVFRYTLFAALLFISCSMRAQFVLHLDPNALDSLYSRTFPLSVAGNSDTPSINVWVYNQGNATYSDSLAFGYSVSGGGFVNGGYSYTTVASGVIFPKTAVIINPQSGAMMRHVKFDFSGPNFVVGSSTVVIWPIVSNPAGVQVDSARVQLTITAPLGIDNAEMNDTKVYLFGSQLYIHSPEIISGDIRIYDIVGHLIATQKISPNTQIPMDHYATGVYAIEITLSDGKRGVYKVFNEAGR